MLDKNDLNLIQELLEKSLKPIKDDIKELKSEVGSLKSDYKHFKAEFSKLKDTVTTLANTLNLETNYIEKELNKVAERYFEERYKGFKYTYLLLKKPKDPFSNKLLTDFDGGYILDQISTKGITSKEKYLFIVEAKHHVSFTNLLNKIQQLYILINYIDHSKKFKKNDNYLLKKPIDDGGKYTKSFIGTVDQFKLNDINKIILCIGGPIWEEKLSEYIEKLNMGKVDSLNNKKDSKLSLEQEKEILEYIKNNNIIAFIPKSINYTVRNSSLLSAGGSGVSNGNQKEFLVPMKILPNYINTKF
jgi:hypothetical protein